MDTTNTFGTEASAADNEWEAGDYRNDLTRDELTVLKQLCKDLGSEKAAWNAFRRKKCLSEMLHDC